MPAAQFRLSDPSSRPRPGDLDEAERQVAAADLIGAGQELLRARTLAFVEAHPDALWRTCGAGHLTGSAVVVDPPAGRVVLLHHRKLARWLQPGGHADGDGDLAGVALREAEEETGLRDLRVVTPAVDIDIHTIPAREGEPAHLHLDLRFVVLAPSGAAPVVNDESHDVRWVAEQDLDRYSAAAELRRLVRRGLDVASRL